MSDTLLEIAGLCKSFGALPVTDGLSLQIETSELHAIIGPNGAGKTSLIHQLSGLLASDGGSIHFEGRDITHAAMAARVQYGLARSFQITSVLEGFSVLENAAMAVQAREGSSFRFFGRASRETALNRQAMETLCTVGLETRAGEVAGHLSHGEKRRLEIAIALATDPKMLLLDEPLAGAGKEESAFLIDLLRSLKHKYTILLVEHDMDAVFALADRISVLVYGRLIATGSPAEIRDNLEVRAAYLGEEDVRC